MTLKEVKLPAMGEGVTEASIIRWLVEEGETIKIDQPLVEIATDKVDSEIPSPFEGILQKIVTQVGAIPRVGEAVAIIALSIDEIESAEEIDFSKLTIGKISFPKPTDLISIQKKFDSEKIAAFESKNLPFAPPYVRMVSQKLQINLAELALFSGKSSGDVFNKTDIEDFIKTKNFSLDNKPIFQENVSPVYAAANNNIEKSPLTNYTGTYRVEEMGRIRKRIADHMVRSSTVIPHVTSFIEADATNMVTWREKNKDAFFKKYKSKLTFTPLFIEAIVFALKKYPEVNVSIDGDKIIYKDFLNIGMATILPDKDLIVPVVKQADTMNLSGLSSTVNDLAKRARERNLKLEEITGSTFTFTNIGVFGTLTGAPLINLPESAILAIGAINKKPDVIKIESGYSIGIRDKVMLSLAYDHRVIDGGLGGLFIKAVAEHIEAFNPDRIV